MLKRRLIRLTNWISELYNISLIRESNISITELSMHIIRELSKLES